VISELELKMKELYIYTPFPFPLLRHFWHAWVREEFGECYLHLYGGDCPRGVAAGVRGWVSISIIIIDAKGIAR
jgi:hypothetical protein